MQELEKIVKEAEQAFKAVTTLPELD